VLQELDVEIAWFEANTDGLVVDNMRNPGGLLCAGENLVGRLTPYPFRATGYELRATWSRVVGFQNALDNARATNAPRWVIDLYEALQRDLMRAYQENRGRTGPIPICSPSLDRVPPTDLAGRSLSYTKPLIMLIDEFSTSTGDSVPAMIQDAKRGRLFGWRTNGAGGTNITPAAGVYSEAFAGVVLGMMTRKDPVAVVGYPTSYYIENIGVQPDVEYDFMTRENLLQRGLPFVNAFTAALLEDIRGR
jgi:C-terminal processing protease CtpA/Prc